MKLFLSHVHEEAKLALVLKKWIESTFAGQLDVFVSSDIKDIPAGSKWLSTIDKALSDSSVFVVLCSTESIKRPWINFETGCACTKNIPVIPVCHSGVSKDTLPPPHSEFQGLNIDDSSFISDLFQSIANYLKINKLPQIDEKQMRGDIQSALTSIRGRQEQEAIPEITTRANDKLDQKAIEIIGFLANCPENYQPTAEEMALRLNLHPTKCKYYIDILEKMEFVYYSLYLSSPPTYYLKSAGRKYAVENSLLV